MNESQKADLFVSVITLLQDKVEFLPSFVAEAYRRLDEQYANFEILLIDNGARDGSAESVGTLLAEYKCLRYLRLSRPVDRETALTAGLDAAIGDYVVTAHPDFDPLSELVPMIELCRSGHDVVLGVDRSPPPTGPFYRLLRSSFVRLSRWLLNLEVAVGTTEFRVLSRTAVNALTRIRTRRRYFLILIADIGLATAMYPYERTSRSGTRDDRNLRQALRTGLSVLLHYSILPLRLVSLAGLVGSVASLAYSLYVVLVYLLKPDVAAGWTTLSLQVSGLFALVFLMLALLGECVGRLMDEGIERPLYHIRDEQSSAVMLADLTRRNVLQEKTDYGPRGSTER